MASPCTNDPNEVISAVIGIQSAEEDFERELDDASSAATENADKFDAFVNGTDTQTVQLGEGSPTPTVRNTVRQMMSAASELPAADISGKSSTANGGTIMRTLSERFSDVVNAKDFGAKGDGATDDTTAIQLAVNSSRYLFIPVGVYKITDTITIPNGFKAIIGEETTRTAHGGSYGSVKFISPDLGENDYMFHCKSSCTFKGVIFQGPGKGYGKALLLKKDYGVDYFDTDCCIEDCVFVMLKDAIEHWNRGLFLQKNSIALCSHAVVLNFDGGTNSDTREGIFSNDGGFRGIDILLNKIHAVTAAIINLGEYKDNLRGLHVSGNTLDIGDNLFTGSARYSVFADNVVDVANSTFLDFYKVENVAITGNTYSYSNDVDGQAIPDNIIIFRNNSKNISITGNTFRGCNGNAIGFLGTADGLIVQSNVFSNICKDGVTTHAGIVLSSGAINSNISNNFFELENSDQTPVRKNSSGSWVNTILLNNISTYRTGTGQPTASYISGLLPFSASNTKVSVSSDFSPDTNADTSSSQYTGKLLGSNSFRWLAVYAHSGYFTNVYNNSGLISSSDERLKTDILDIDENLLKAWENVRFKVFKYKDAVSKKGKAARMHVGVIAQDVEKAFSAQDINANRYGLFCYDQYPAEYSETTIVDSPASYDENGNEVSPEITHKEIVEISQARDAYSIRYEEALVLECAYQRWLGEQRDARIAELEAKLNELSGNNPAPSDASPDNL